MTHFFRSNLFHVPLCRSESGFGSAVTLRSHFPSRVLVKFQKKISQVSNKILLLVGADVLSLKSLTVAFQNSLEFLILLNLSLTVKKRLLLPLGTNAYQCLNSLSSSDSLFMLDLKWALE